MRATTVILCIVAILGCDQPPPPAEPTGIAPYSMVPPPPAPEPIPPPEQIPSVTETPTDPDPSPSLVESPPDDPAGPPPAVGRHRPYQPAVQDGTVRIVMPDNSRVVVSMQPLGADWKDSLFPADSVTYLSQHPTGQIAGAARVDAGRLHGPLVSLSLDGNLTAHVAYDRGMRVGAWRFWDVDGSPKMFALYRRDKLDEYQVWFKDGIPTLLRLWSAGSLGGTYFLVQQDAKTIAKPSTALTPEELRQSRMASRELAEFEAKLDEVERPLKSEVASWYREGVEKERMANFVAGAQGRRMSQKVKQAANQARSQEALQSLWRAGTTGTTMNTRQMRRHVYGGSSDTGVRYVPAR